MAIVVHLLRGDRSWRYEAAKETQLRQALGAKAKHAVSDYKHSTGDPKWVLLAYDKHGVIAAVDRASVAELTGKLGEFPEVKQALDTAS